MKHLRLYFIGMLMGIADLIPGISGGTIAFIAGIYEELLVSIKTLQFHSFKKIAWPFLLTLGSGILTSVLLFSKLFCFLFINFKSPLMAFFFGLILASTLQCARECKIKKRNECFALGLGLVLSFGLTILPTSHFLASSFFGIMCAGALGAAAMLLPGISGSFLLQILGIYPLLIYALAVPTAPGSLKLILSIGLGIAFGLICCSRLVAFLLNHFQRVTLLILIGFMGGGLKSLWPFEKGNIFFPMLFLVSGFLSFILLELSLKHFKSKRIAD